MHQADLMAARMEYEKWRDQAPQTVTKSKPATPKKAVSSSSQGLDTNRLFKDLFGA
jgi:hypothetical protein